MNPVERQVDAYNAHDLDAFVACYTDDIVISDGAGAVLAAIRSTGSWCTTWRKTRSIAPSG